MKDLHSVEERFEIVAYAVAAVSAALAAWTYRAEARRRRALWATKLFEKFHETDRYRRIRDLLDCEPGSEESAGVGDIVLRGDREFTDYLNFFEFVRCLVETGQVRKDDFKNLFAYYTGCLLRHQAVVDYIKEKSNGFEHLKRHLK